MHGVRVVDWDWCPWQKYDFGLSPAAVQFFLQLDAAVGKISDPVGSPNLLLQVNSTWHAHIRMHACTHGGMRPRWALPRPT